MNARQRYEDIKALNWSTLKLMSTSAAYTRYREDHPDEEEDKPAYVTGRAVHAAILEPDVFEDLYIVQPKFDRRTTVGKQGYAQFLESLPDGAQLLSPGDHDMAVRCAEFAAQNQQIQRYLEGAKCEHAAQWKIDGVDCKGRIDAIANDRIIDLKTTRHNSLSKLEADAASYDYHAQLAWYHDGSVRAGLISGERLPAAIFLHSTAKSSFIDFAILDMDGCDNTLDYGRAKYHGLLQKYIGCKTTKWWPGMANNPVRWILPEWKLYRDLDEHAQYLYGED